MDDFPTMFVTMSRDGKQISGECPFCKKTHTHGTAGERGPDFGHRVSHCEVDDPRGGDGYYVRLVPGS